MIRSFKCKETAGIWQGHSSRAFPPDIQDRAIRKLRLIDAAQTLDDMVVPPSNRLKQLKGKRKGLWSIRINDQWRVCFRWSDNDAHDVEIVDYH